MSILSRSLLATAVAAAMTWNFPAHALSMHECSVKYRAAQTAKTLNGMSWKEFQKAECGPGAAAAPTSTSAAPTGGPTNTNVVLPTAISPKYAGLPAGRARMLTCLDQFKANKADNMNGGLKWIQKGGGYYSMCNRHLKGDGA
jgi:hypothetical protein